MQLLAEKLGVASDEISEAAYVAFLCPAFPSVKDPEIAEAVAAGQTPVMLARSINDVNHGELPWTNKEATAWLQETGGTTTPFVWSIAKLQLPPRSPTPEYWATVEWLQHMAKKPATKAAVKKRRRVQAPDGTWHEFSVLDLLAHVEPAHTAKEGGVFPGVDRVLARMQSTLAQKYFDHHKGDARDLTADLPEDLKVPRDLQLPPEITELKTPAALVYEGREMDHCVGQYITRIESGLSTVFAACVNNVRTTFELSPEDGTLRQHHAQHDTPPPEASVNFVNSFVAKYQASKQKKKDQT